jgi:hypothetical protein
MPRGAPVRPVESAGPGGAAAPVPAAIAAPDAVTPLLSSPRSADVLALRTDLDRAAPAGDVPLPPPPAMGAARTPAPTAPAPRLPHNPAAGIDAREAEGFVQAFRGLYERRDLGRLMALFAEDAVENDRVGRAAIAAGYRAIFGRVHQVTYTLGPLDVDAGCDETRVRSPFVIAYARPDGFQTVRGTASWEIIRREGALRIARLSYELER